MAITQPHAQSHPTLFKTPQASLKKMSDALRFLAIDAVNQANSGHPGMPMGMADIVAVLFSEFMHFNPQEPSWPGRDRFILSNGHGSMLQYGLLHLLGYDVSMDDLKNFRQLGSPTPGHPEYGHTAGIETTTGPLGQGFAMAVGMALAQKHMAAQHQENLFGNKTYVTVGDGCLMEGISHEAAEFAGRMKLSGLVALFDSNSISIDGETHLASVINIEQRFQAYGWSVHKADGHNYDDIRSAFEWAQKQEKPAFIIFTTHIGFGSKNLQDSAKVHGSPLGADEAAAVRKALDWQSPPFEIPSDVSALWHQAAEHGKRSYSAWQEAFKNLDENMRLALEERLTNKASSKTLEALQQIKKEAVKQLPTVATRKASGMCIDSIVAHQPNFISGSADLTGSNNTKAEQAVVLDDTNYGGNYIHYGVREHGMAAIMNGLSLYGGIRPAGGTFLVFSDYLRPALRLSALTKQPVVYVLTHDSIGLGEDGPTHQPIEHLAMLRATPNLTTWRPADLVETAECWENILMQTEKPSVLALSRQGLPTVRNIHEEQNLCAKGGYILRRELGELQGIFLASGSEVHLAVEAFESLQEHGIHTRVVSVPSLETFLAQDQAYKDEILPQNIKARIVLEAASAFGWHALAPHGSFICMESFGASAPAEDLYTHFGITVDNAIQTMTKTIKE